MKKENSTIAIIGLSGKSIFMTLDELPKPSVTLHANSYHIEPGGKGYNQAIACHKLGCSVSYLSKIGNDEYGIYCKEYMEKLGIQTYFIQDESEHTALATILTANNGENEVIVYPGASKNLCCEDIKLFAKEIKDASVLLLQYENNLDIIKEAVAIAKESKTIVILNPAPAIYDEREILENVDILTPNLEEAKKLYHIPNNILIDNIGEYLVEKIDNIVIVTLGSKGCLLIKDKTYKFYKGYHVKAIDTTGAGDIFNAALAVSIARNNTIDEAIEFALAVSALSVTKPYVINSIPNNDEICEFIKLYNLKQKY